MRGFDCQCGEYIQADNDQRLVQSMREHVQTAHPNDQFSDAQLQQMAEQGAYDVRDEANA